MFVSDKKVALRRMVEFDRSSVGSVDEAVKPLLDLINSHSRFYTTSSCAGRIILLETPKSGRKNEARFVLRSHEPVSVSEVERVLSSYSSRNTLWLRVEGVILHVCARTLKDGFWLVSLFRSVGFKRSGVFSYKRERVMIEALAPESLVVPVFVGGSRVVSSRALSVLVSEANDLLRKTRVRLSRLESLLRRELFK